MNKSKFFYALIVTMVLVLVAVALVGCILPDQDEETPKDVAVTGIVLSQEAVTLEEGETVQLTATIVPDNATNKNIIWSSDDTSRATVTQDGLITALVGAAGKSCNVIAQTEDGEKDAICEVYIIAPKGEAIAKTATVADTTNNLTIYTGGTVELTGSAAMGATALAIEPYSGTYTVENNAFLFTGTIVAMGFPFPLLNSVSFPDGKLSLRLYVNNGTTDFELGTYEFTKEEAAKLGIDTDVAYVITSATNVLGDKIDFYSDNTAIGSATVPVLGTAPFTFETTWTKNDADNTIAIADTAEAVATNSLFGDLVISCVATTKGTGIEIIINGLVAGSPSPITTVLIDRLVANEKLGFNIPYIPVTELTWDTTKLDDNGKLALTAGARVDLNTISTLAPANSSLTGIATLTVDAGGEYITVSGTTVIALRAGTATITAKVDDVVKTLDIVITDPANTYESAVLFDTAIAFENVAEIPGFGSMVLRIDFNTDGTCYFSGSLGMIVLSSSYGYYTLEKTEDVITSVKINFFDATIATDTFQQTGEVVLTVGVAEGGMTLTAVNPEDNTETVFTEVVTPQG